MKKTKTWLYILLLTSAAIVYSLYASKYQLSVTYHTLSSAKLTNPIRVVLIADLHNSQFGSNNEKLVSRIQEQKPDLILAVGDLLNGDEETTAIVSNLLTNLVQIAPVYVSYGNHELEHEENYKTDIQKLYEETGVKFLHYEYEDIIVKEQTIRIGGIYGYCLPDTYLKTGEAKIEQCAYLHKLQQTQHHIILLTHMPASWIINTNLNYWKIDSVFAGHAHGGQIRIPFIGGVYAPDQGYFPGKVEGVFTSQNQQKHLILTRGLGSTGKIPRFNNIPEIMVVDFIPESQ